MYALFKDGKVIFTNEEIFNVWIWAIRKGVSVSGNVTTEKMDVTLHDKGYTIEEVNEK